MKDVKNKGKVGRLKKKHVFHLKIPVSENQVRSQGNSIKASWLGLQKSGKMDMTDPNL